QRRQREAEQQQREEARRQARETRERERLARELARQQEAAEKQARRTQYLAQLRQGTRLGGKTCYGEKHVLGVLPQIRPREVACVDVHFSVRCPGDQGPRHRGVMDTMVSNAGGCFGDTTEVPKDIGCAAEAFQVQVEQVVPCQ
ncbi:MAG: hypothetical protein SV765_17835, partial [Pseudomonadota bacterium]|nr:hypothetical protein [Pseudomonadota bacterium]